MPQQQQDKQQQPHKQPQQQHAQEPPRQRPSIMLLVAEHPSAGGIYLSNLLCMPRLTLLWHWLTGEWRTALGLAVGRPDATSGSSSSSSRAMGGTAEGDESAGDAAAEAAAGSGAAVDGGISSSGGAGGSELQEGWQAVDGDLGLLRALQQKIEAAVPTKPAAANTTAVESAHNSSSSGPQDPQQQRQQQQQHQGQSAPSGLVRLFSPPFGGSDWDWTRFWGGWLAAPGVLVALQVVQSSSHEPWFVLYVAWLGLLRLCAEAYALYVALFTDLSSAEQLDKLVVSHAVPAGVHLVLAALQAMFAPLMPRLVLVTLFWMRCLAVPLLNLWAIYSSWQPDGQQGDRSPERRRRRRHHHHRSSQQLALLQTGGGASGGGGEDPSSAGGGIAGAAAGTGAAEAAAAGARQPAAPNGTSNQIFYAQPLPPGVWQDRGAAAAAAVVGVAALGQLPQQQQPSSSSSASRPVHWPPPLPIPRDLDDLADAPEAFRCVPCCAVLCCAVLRCAALCCAVLCCAVLCCAVL